METLKQHIFLLGFMGTGKSAVAARLAELLNTELADTDQLIVEKSNMDIPHIFSKKGEQYFRDMETQVLKELRDQKPHIISCGGGLPLREENRQILKTLGTAVLLTASARTVYDRVRNDDQRPLLSKNMNVEYIENLMKERQEIYCSTADLMISTDHEKIEDICGMIIANLT